jgi:hypothetical protein
MCVTRPEHDASGTLALRPSPRDSHGRTKPRSRCYTGLRAKHSIDEGPHDDRIPKPCPLAACTLAGCAEAAGLPPPAAQRPQPFAQSAGSRVATPCLTAPCIYVTNPTDREIPRVAGRVLIFPANANGDAPPAAEIVGSKTHRGHPGGIAVDAQHNVYVANLRSVGVYAPGTYGNAPPARMIAGAHTNLLYPSGIAVDASGEIYDTDPQQTPTVLVFASGSNGNVPPIHAISGSQTEMTNAFAIAVR